MELKFTKLVCFLLLPVAASSGLHSHPSQSPSANHKPEDTICHGLTCYPRVFVPTHEFQTIHDDQQVPQGLHYRINIATGVREAKINVPDEGKDIESTTIHLPSEGGRGDIVLVEQANEEKAESTLPNIILKGSKAEKEDEDGHGAIKPPPSLKSEEMTFTDSVDIVLAGEKEHTPERIIAALNSLENLVHEIYWGLKISTPENISSLLRLISTSSNPTIRSAAALVIGSALQNNPKALTSAIGPYSSKNRKIAHMKLIPTLLSSLRAESDSHALSRILYALNHSIKSPKTISEFHSQNGLLTLHSLFQSTNSDNGEFKAKCSTFIEDNFLNPDFQKDLDRYGRRPSEKAGSTIQKILGRVGKKEADKLLLSFCQPLQNSLLYSEQDGIFDDDAKGKMLSALVALRKKFGTSEKQGCALSNDFLAWFDHQIDTKGKSIEQLEDEGKWFKLKALEFYQEGYFNKADKEKKTKCKGCWF